MVFKKLNKEFLHFLKEYGYFHDSIINEIHIVNPDKIDERGYIIQNQKSYDSVEIKLEQQHVQAVTKTEMKLNNVHELHILGLSKFIVFDVVVKEEALLKFSFTGGFGEEDIWFSAEEIEFIETTPLPEKYRLPKDS